MKKGKSENSEVIRELESDDSRPEDWDRIRKSFNRRAQKENLVEISYEMHESPYGPLLIGATETGLVRVGLSAESEQEILEDLARRISPRILRAGRPQITTTRTQLDQYFAGERQVFDLPLDRVLTRGFRREVLAATEAIPYGDTSSYRALAIKAGSPKAVRAAGTALATNPLPIIVPCHRVLRSDGKIGSYLGGTSMKEKLLEMERTVA